MELEGLEDRLAPSVNQWASNVIAFSSQASPTANAATQALNAPDTNSYGDAPTAWAPQTPSSNPEYISLGYATPVYATAVDVHETYGNGAVTEIALIDTTGAVHPIWSGTDPTPAGSPGDLVVSAPASNYLVQGVQVWVDPTLNPAARPEIDAVQLLGQTTATATISWTGAGDGSSWNDPLNWTGYRLPTAIDAVYIGAGANVTLPQVMSGGSVVPTPVQSLTCDGTLTVQGDLQLTANSAINGQLFTTGTVEVQNAANLLLGGGGQLGGTISLANAGATVTMPSGAFTFATGLAITGSGVLVVPNAPNANTSISVAGNVSVTNVSLSSGTLGGPGNLTVTGAFTWNGGAMQDPSITQVGGGTLTANAVTVGAGQFNLGGGVVNGSVDVYAGATFTGAGTINGNLNNSGTVTIGTGAVTGTLNVTGGFLQTNTGTLNVNLGGPFPGSSDLLNVGGSAFLDGTLGITLVPAFTPASGNVFNFLTCAANGRSGRFATIAPQGGAANFTWLQQPAANGDALQVQ